MLERDPSYYENEAREKAVMDHNQMMFEARTEGEAKGEAKIIQRLLETMPLEQVAQALKMSVEDVQRIVNA